MISLLHIYIDDHDMDTVMINNILNNNVSFIVWKQSTSNLFEEKKI